MSAQIVALKAAGTERKVTSDSRPRKDNEAYRVEEHLTESEVDKLLAALKGNRHGHRDWLIGLLIYRHGLRVSEACDLRWDDIDLSKRTIIVRRLKGSTDSSHYLERDELAGLKRLRHQQAAKYIKSPYVFVNERGEPFRRMGDAAHDRARWRALLLHSRNPCPCSALDGLPHWPPREWIRGDSTRLGRT